MRQLNRLTSGYHTRIAYGILRVAHIRGWDPVFLQSRYDLRIGSGAGKSFNNGVDFRDIHDAVVTGGEARISDQIRPADGLKQGVGEAFRGRADRDIAVLGSIYSEWSQARHGEAGSLWDSAALQQIEGLA